MLSKNETGERRPTCITVISWFWIIIGILMVVCGPIFFSLGEMPEANIDNYNQGELLGRSALVSVLFRHSLLVVMIQTVIASLAIVSGIFLLRLHSWARLVLEGISWLGIILIVGSYFLNPIGWSALHSEKVPMVVSILGIITDMVVTAMYAVPLGVVIYFLRSQTVRDAVLYKDLEHQGARG